MPRKKSETSILLLIDSDADAEATEEAVGEVVGKYDGAKLILPITAEAFETLDSRTDDEEADPIFYAVGSIAEAEETPMEVVVYDAATKRTMQDWTFNQGDDEYKLKEFQNITFSVSKNPITAAMGKLDGDGPVVVLFGTEPEEIVEEVTYLDGLDGLEEVEFSEEDEEAEETEEDEDEEEEEGEERDSDDEDFEALVTAVSESLISALDPRFKAIEKLLSGKTEEAPVKRGPGRPKGSTNKAAPAKRGPGRPKGSTNKR